MKKYIRILAFVSTLILMFSMISCTKQQNINADTKTVQTENGKPFQSDTTIKIVIPSHSSWPYQPNWKTWQYAKEGSGANLQIQAIPSSEFYTKIPLLFATPNELPDIIAFDYKPATDKYVSQGALVSIDDYSDKMPHYNAFLNNLSQEDRDKLIRGRKAYDGKIYYAPVNGAESIQNVRTWLYRKDIFDKEGIKPPKTMDDLYNVAVQLKKLYPESSPICMRAGLNNINVMGPSWKPYFCWNWYYDYNAGKWNYGVTESTMLDIIKYMIKLLDAKVIPPDYLTINSKSWEELVTTDRGFIMPEYQTRIDFFNPLGREANSKFNLTATEPPYVENGTGKSKVNRFNYDPKGLVICNTGDKKRIENSISYIDWLYSEEALELLSWGKEGETYKTENGNRKFILDEAGNAAQKLYGVQTYGTYLRFDPKAAFALSSKELSSTTEMVLAHSEENYNPTLFLAFNKEEDQVVADIGIEVDTYAQEMLSKFLLKQEPISKWDSFQKNLKDLGVDKVLAVYESAYSRIK